MRSVRGRCHKTWMKEKHRKVKRGDYLKQVFNSNEVNSSSKTVDAEAMKGERVAGKNSMNEDEKQCGAKHVFKAGN